jgi:hypothetical protein
MALTSSLVRVAVEGSVYRGATSAAAPTATTSTLTGFTELGYIGEGGVTEAGDRSTTDIRAWQNGDVVRTVVTESSVTFAFEMLETSLVTLETYYGTTATTDATEGSIEIRPAETGGRYSWVFDIIDGAHATRIHVPEGEIIERGSITYENGGAVRYPVTIKAYPVDGVAATKFSTALATA